MEPPLHIKKHSSSAFWYGGAAPYQKALYKCGYQSTLYYEPPTTNKWKDSQQNNILWYNQPLSKNVSTNIRHRFLAIIDKQFPKDHKLWRIFNHNTIKICYSYINNTKRTIDNCNKQILNSSKHFNDTTDNTNAKDTETCTCQQKNTCPLNGNCLQSSLIYQATVTCKDNRTTETYIRLAENNFKTRYRNHTTSFQHTKHRNSTELSKHIWTLKENNIDHFILWHILSSRSPYNNASKRCNLCLKEKLLIIHQPELSSLNKRNEHVSSCHHRNKQLLCILTIEQSIEISRHAFMQVCKLYKWWLWIFFTIKSPDEWVITKQACRDESIVSVFSPIS